MNKLESDFDLYKKHVNECVEPNNEHFKDESLVARSTASASSSRNSSPARRKTFLHMKHLLPEVLTQDCTMAEFNKFDQDFSTWLEAS